VQILVEIENISNSSQTVKGEVSMKRRMVIGSIAVSVLTLTLGIAAAKANFTGTWVMDKTKSEGLQPGVEQTMTITQAGDTLTLENKIVSEQGDLTVNDSYNIDGKEAPLTQKRNGQEVKGKRTAKWSADGNGFESVEELTVEAADGQTITQHITRKWVMSGDGKTFTIEMNIKGPNGEQTTKRTFVKK
jgi:hypothetical protein